MKLSLWYANTVVSAVYCEHIDGFSAADHAHCNPTLFMNTATFGAKITTSFYIKPSGNRLRKGIAEAPVEKIPRRNNFSLRGRCEEACRGNIYFPLDLCQ